MKISKENDCYISLLIDRVTLYQEKKEAFSLNEKDIFQWQKHSFLLNVCFVLFE